VSDSVAFERLISADLSSTLRSAVRIVFSGIKIDDFIRDIQTFSMATRITWKRVRMADLELLNDLFGRPAPSRRPPHSLMNNRTVSQDEDMIS
jgi:hypothetical protein